MKWLLQSVGKTQMLKDNFQTLNEMNENYSTFGLINGEDILTNLENCLTSIDDDYILRGGTKLIALLQKYASLEKINDHLNDFQKENAKIFFKKMKNGVFYDEQNFDQYFYSKIELPLLNSEAFFIPIRENKEKTFTQDLFIKPSKDLKTFIPGIIKAGQSIQEFIENTQHLKNYDHELALISPLQIIEEEYRFFVVEKDVITGSLYKKNEQVIYSNQIPDKIWKTAKIYAQLFQPHDVFTMDLALTPKGIKIIEYNCWNGSGLYHSDKKAIFSSVKEYIEKKTQNNDEKKHDILKKF